MNPSNAVRALRARPVAALAAIFVVTIMGNALLVSCGGQSQQSSTEQPQNGTTTPPAGETTPSTTSGEVSVATGQKVYTDRCVLCHGASGKGDGAGAAGLDPKPRDHTDGAYMNARTDDDLLGVIRNGKGNMPAWGSILSEAEQQSVLLYVRSLAVPPYPGASH